MEEQSKKIREIRMRGKTKEINWLSRQSIQHKLMKLFIYICLTVGGIIICIPFWWMISTSLKVPGREFVFPPEWIPNPIYWRNYIEGWARTGLDFNRWLGNTVFITGFSMIGTIISVSLVAYGFARLRFPGRDMLFILCLITMMIPQQVTIVPIFILFRWMGWLDTFKPLIIPHYFAAGPIGAFFIFLMRQFYLTIPAELTDAAIIDGCGAFGVFSRIMFPLSKPAVGIMAVFSFMFHWNDFINPLIYLYSYEKYTLALGLRFFQGMVYIRWAQLMAVSLLILLPCVVLFFVAQKYYIQGIVITGVKG